MHLWWMNNTKNMACDWSTFEDNTILRFGAQRITVQLLDPKSIAINGIFAGYAIAPWKAGFALLLIFAFHDIL